VETDARDPEILGEELRNRIPGRRLDRLPRDAMRDLDAEALAQEMFEAEMTRDRKRGVGCSGGAPLDNERSGDRENRVNPRWGLVGEN
jgi:hypothetical protein